MSLIESTSAGDVFALAAGLGLIPSDGLDDLRRECRDGGQSPMQFLAVRGLLTAVDVDILETLAAPAEVIPGYRVQGLIGKGGMGVVYRAEQRALGRTVALKTILVSRMADRSILDRFELEARTIGQLRHPNIIIAHDFGRSSGRVYLAMELVEGTDLDRRIKEDGPIAESIVWGLAQQTAAGLAHACEQHVVHRDIKPANLMLVEPPAGYPLPAGMPMVKIADFGLALLQEDVAADTRLTAPDATVGSPHYMAPEQLETSHVDHRADMYALGATVFHALAGRPPFSGMKLSQLISAKLGAGAPRIETVRPELSAATCALVARLLAREPADRPADYGVLLSEIDQVIRRLPTADAPAMRFAAEVSTVIGAEDQAPRGATSPEQRTAITTTLQAAPTLAGRELRATISPVRHRKLRRVVFAAVLAAAACGLVWWSLREAPWPTLADRGARERIGDVVPLFNGVNTGGWQIGHGNWVPVADEGVLQGTKGIIIRPLPRRRDLGLTDAPADRPPLWYRLELLLRGAPLSGSGASELHFGLNDGALGVCRFVVRRSGDELLFGTRTGDRAEFTRDERVPSRRLPAFDDAAIELERLPAGWFITVNGEPFAAIPLEERPLPEFRLLAEGTARFADLYLQAERPKEP